MAKPITVSIVGNAGPLRKSLGDADKSLSSFSKNIGDHAKKAGIAFLGFGTAAAAGLAMAAKAAAEDQKAQALLANQVRESTGATTLQIAELEKFVDVTQRATGVADSQLRPALQTLARATGDLDQAQQLLNLSLDVAAGTFKDVDTVALGLAKAFNGNIGALTKLGIPLDESIVKSKDFAAAQKVLSEQFAGASATAAGTFEGKLNRLRIVFDELVESIGYAVLENRYVEDVILRLPDATQAAIDAFGRDGLSGALKAFTGNLGVTGAYIDAFFLSTRVSALEFTKGVFKAIAPLTIAFDAINSVVSSVLGKPAPKTLAATLNEDLGRTQFELDVTVAKIKQLEDILADKAAAERASAAETQRFEEIARSFGVELEKTSKTVGDFGGGGGGGGGGAVDKAAEAVKKLRGELEGQFPKALDAAAAIARKATDEFDAYAKSIEDAILRTLNYSDAYDAGKESGKGFLDALRSQAELGRVYAERIQQLVAAGLEGPALQQVVDAGAETGIRIADELLKSNANILEANKLGADLTAAAKRAGEAAAKQFKIEGVNAATNLLQGVEETLSSYQIRLTSQNLTAKQLRQLKEQFYVDVAFLFQTSGYAIPKLADGGLITRPTMALVGEAGPELVIPLDRLGGMGGGDTYVEVNINAAVADARLGDVIVQALRDVNRRSGPLDITVL
jgi:hypothetical protein